MEHYIVGKISYKKDINYDKFDDETEEIINVSEKSIQIQYIEDGNVKDIEIDLFSYEDMTKLKIGRLIQIPVYIGSNGYILFYQQGGEITDYINEIEIPY